MVVGFTGVYISIIPKHIIYETGGGVEIGAGSSKCKDSDFDIYTGSAGFLFPAG